MGDYLLGLDAGNTVTKAVLFDLAGREISAAEVGVRSRMPAPGHVERDLDELFESVLSVLARCIDGCGVSPSEIRAIGCAGHGNGLYALDHHGNPLIGIQSLDTRATALVAEWSRDNTGAAAFERCLQKPWPAQTPTLLAWLARHRPEIYGRIGTVLLAKDYVLYRLTGARCSDTSDMAGCGLLRLPERVYDRHLMQAYGLEDTLDLLPELRESADIAGRVTPAVAERTGLLAGTPVVAGLFDVVASAIGSGVTETGTASIIAGTWSINQVVTDRPLRDPSVFMVSTFDRERYVAIESSATSAANLEWMARELLTEDGRDPGALFAACSDLVAETSPTEDLPVYHPFLFGAQQNGAARAGFYGIAGWHRRGHLLRALFEGVVMEHRRHVEVLRRAGVGIKEATLSGGGSRSRVWPQIFADVVGVPVAVAKGRETGALGAAIVAGVGVGAFSAIRDGASAMTAITHRYDPDPSLGDHYLRRAALFDGIGEAMRPIWQRMSERRARCDAGGSIDDR
jgi:L-xylulokinase